MTDGKHILTLVIVTVFASLLLGGLVLVYIDYTHPRVVFGHSLRGKTLEFNIPDPARAARVQDSLVHLDPMSLELKGIPADTVVQIKALWRNERPRVTATYSAPLLTVDFLFSSASVQYGYCNPFDGIGTSTGGDDFPELSRRVDAINQNIVNAFKLEFERIISDSNQE